MESPWEKGGDPKLAASAPGRGGGGRDGAGIGAAEAVRLAFEFLVLAARSAEDRLATWDETDTAGAVWFIPACG